MQAGKALAPLLLALAGLVADAKMAVAAELDVAAVSASVVNEQPPYDNDPQYYFRATVRIRNASMQPVGVAIFYKGERAIFTASSGEQCKPVSWEPAVRGLPSMWRTPYGRGFEGTSAPLAPGEEIVAHFSLYCELAPRAASGIFTIPLYVVKNGRPQPLPVSLRVQLQ